MRAFTMSVSNINLMMWSAWNKVKNKCIQTKLDHWSGEVLAQGNCYRQWQGSEEDYFLL